MPLPVQAQIRFQVQPTLSLEMKINKGIKLETIMHLHGTTSNQDVWFPIRWSDH